MRSVRLPCLVPIVLGIACAPAEQTPIENEPVSTEIVIDPLLTAFTTDGGLAPGQLALTFDDGPDPLTTPRILDILDSHRVQATFFQVGFFAEAHRDVIADVLARGHTLGSHSFSHADLTTLSLQVAIDDIERGHAAVADAASGAIAPFFRFPMFATSQQLLDAVADRGLAVLHANIITEDWMTPGPDELLAKSLAAVETEGGGIVLFHDNQPQTADMLDAFLTDVIGRGYETVVFRPRKDRKK
jgi:peptidoglycan-N-acetylglucosamine deacetylase